MNRYVVKDMKKREYKNIFGETDYDIPMFGFKSAVFIIGMTILSLLICVNLMTYLGVDFRLPNAFVSGCVSGFSVAFSQFFIERKDGICKQFWIVGLIMSCIAFLIIFMVG